MSQWVWRSFLDWQVPCRWSTWQVQGPPLITTDGDISLCSWELLVECLSIYGEGLATASGARPQVLRCARSFRGVFSPCHSRMHLQPVGQTCPRIWLCSFLWSLGKCYQQQYCRAKHPLGVTLRPDSGARELLPESCPVFSAAQGRFFWLQTQSR